MCASEKSKRTDQADCPKRIPGSSHSLATAASRSALATGNVLCQIGWSNEGSSAQPPVAGGAISIADEQKFMSSSYYSSVYLYGGDP